MGKQHLVMLSASGIPNWGGRNNQVEVAVCYARAPQQDNYRLLAVGLFANPPADRGGGFTGGKNDIGPGGRQLTSRIGSEADQRTTAIPVRCRTIEIVMQLLALASPAEGLGQCGFKRPQLGVVAMTIAQQ